MHSVAARSSAEIGSHFDLDDALAEASPRKSRAMPMRSLQAVRGRRQLRNAGVNIGVNVGTILRKAARVLATNRGSVVRAKGRHDRA